MLPSTLGKKIDYMKQVMFLLLRNIHSCYFLQLSCETWRLWVTQSGFFLHYPPPLLKRKSSPESSPGFPTGPSDMDISSRGIINQNTDPASENGTGESEVIMFLWVY